MIIRGKVNQFAWSRQTNEIRFGLECGASVVAQSKEVRSLLHTMEIGEVIYIDKDVIYRDKTKSSIAIIIDQKDLNITNNTTIMVQDKMPEAFNLTDKDIQESIDKFIEHNRGESFEGAFNDMIGEEILDVPKPGAVTDVETKPLIFSGDTIKIDEEKVAYRTIEETRKFIEKMGKVNTLK
jgi:hypothetical protein